MEITREHIGQTLVHTYGSQSGEFLGKPRRVPLTREVMVIAINPADDCENDILVGYPSGPAELTRQEWVSADKLSELSPERRQQLLAAQLVHPSALQVWARAELARNDLTPNDYAAATVLLNEYADRLLNDDDPVVALRSSAVRKLARKMAGGE